MNDPVEARLATLAARAARLRAIGKWAMVAGLSLIGLAIVISWPDPAGRDLIDDYVVPPEALRAWLLARGATLSEVPSAMLENGAWVVRRLGFAIPILLFGSILLKRLVPSIVWRIILFVTSPIWLGMLTAGQHSTLILAANDGTIVDRAGAPPVPSPVTNRAPIRPFHLRPETLPQPLADQAHYVLAQQAYLDRDTARAALHLGALAGAWQPAQPAERVRLDMLARWAQAHGHSPGAAARWIGAGPNPWLRRACAFLLAAIAAALALGGLGVELVGLYRGRRHARLERRFAALPAASPAATPPSPPGPRIGFGRRVAA